MTASNRSVHRYQIFGLTLSSEVELPELPVAPPGPVDVEIRREAPRSLDRAPGLEVTPDGAWLSVEDVGAYHIAGGARIVVRPVPEVPERNLRLFLLGSALGLLLHQRGIFPLHANAVDLGGRAVAFMGESGAGKSTLAAWFHDQGLAVVADDVSAITLDADGRPWVAQGVPRLRLWREAVLASGRSVEDYPESFLGRADVDKFDVAIALDRPADPLPVAGVFLLERGEELAIERLSGVAAVDALFTHTYRGGFIPMLGEPAQHWKTALAIASKVPIFVARRRWSHSALGSDAAALLKFARSL